MNNAYSPDCQGWKHNSFNEAVVVLENARNMLSCTGWVPPIYHRNGYLLAFLTYLDDHAYIGGKETVNISFTPDEDSYNSIDLMDNPFDDIDDYNVFDNDLY